MTGRGKLSRWYACRKCTTIYHATKIDTICPKCGSGWKIRVRTFAHSEPFWKTGEHVRELLR
jgi:rRNA maturation endonuclease Nob1